MYCASVVGRALGYVELNLVGEATHTSPPAVDKGNQKYRVVANNNRRERAREKKKAIISRFKLFQPSTLDPVAGWVGKIDFSVTALRADVSVPSTDGLRSCSVVSFLHRTFLLLSSPPLSLCHIFPLSPSIPLLVSCILRSPLITYLSGQPPVRRLLSPPPLFTR